MWGHLKDKVVTTPPQKIDALRQKVIDEFEFTALRQKPDLITLCIAQNGRRGDTSKEKALDDKCEINKNCLMHIFLFSKFSIVIRLRHSNSNKGLISKAYLLLLRSRFSILRFRDFSSGIQSITIGQFQRVYSVDVQNNNINRHAT
jgi:hypothetical protein